MGEMMDSFQVLGTPDKVTVIWKRALAVALSSHEVLRPFKNSLENRIQTIDASQFLPPWRGCGRSFSTQNPNYT